jgi:hypothetical protein
MANAHVDDVAVRVGKRKSKKNERWVSFFQKCRRTRKQEKPPTDYFLLI